MELVFLGLLLFLMVFALSSGFPVAFSLPGAAIATITLAALTGYVLEGSTDAYFVGGDGPQQWLSAGVTNFRSLYWGVDRDTLIAVPLFIFMGIVLQHSKIAEDLLVAMAQLFGPIPGGLGISVVIVGALLAATTGIVGATVIAMGLISLPAMLRNHYSKSLATGTICASGTLGQIIPPSIVLIILADQLSSAADQANTARKELYRAVTGEYAMPSQFEVVSASAGDMFMGALIPGLILVGIYILYIFVFAWLKPEKAPPVPYKGKYDHRFAARIFIALIPPLALILVVLGSIILGVATVNQAGAIGAIGAMIMAGYRLHTGYKALTYIPLLLSLIAIVVLAFLLSQYDLNVRNIQTELQGKALSQAIIAVGVLLAAIVWSMWRIFRIENTLKVVMTETARTTSMVFVILLGAAMLTAAFRAFGGEELVKQALHSLPGGFWTQFLVVMLVIFFLGFFLDFIEIAVVVVPIVAPILLMNPEANVTAVWFGVMVGLNIQTSFLTPPFGFALFYLRGVADKVVKTLDIYKGATVFISLQLIGLAIVGYFPSLVNYLPNRTYLLSENSPPPINPKLQLCLQDYTSEQLAKNGDAIQTKLIEMQQADLSVLPEAARNSLLESNQNFQRGFELLAKANKAQQALDAFAVDYAPLHHEVRAIQANIAKLEKHIKTYESEIQSLRFNRDSTDADETKLRVQIEALQQQKTALENSIPETWESQHEQYKALNNELTVAQRDYYNTVDPAYQSMDKLYRSIQDAPTLQTLLTATADLQKQISAGASAEAMIAAIEAQEGALAQVEDTGRIKKLLAKARRTLKKAETSDSRVKSNELLQQAYEQQQQAVQWRQLAKQNFMPTLAAYHAQLAPSLGIRSQEKLTEPQAKHVAACLAQHRDISLNF